MCVDCRSEPDFTEYFVGMLLPESWGFGMTLHSGEDRNHVTIGDRIAFKMVDPPFVKSPVGFDKEWLLRWWGFCKRIGDVGTKNE